VAIISPRSSCLALAHGKYWPTPAENLDKIDTDGAD
jgi:hypothetical protein